MSNSPFPKAYPDEPQERKKVDTGTGVPEKAEPGTLLQELLAPGAPVFVSTKKKKSPDVAQKQSMEQQEALAEAVQRSAHLVFALGIIVIALTALSAVTLFLIKKNDLPKPVPPSESPYFVEADKGGVLTSPEGLAIYIPPGVLQRNTQFEIKKIENGRVTDLFFVGPAGVTFSRPVVISVPYHKEASKIRLQIWKDPQGPRQQLSYTIDTEEKRLDALLTKL